MLPAKADAQDAEYSNSWEIVHIDAWQSLIARSLCVVDLCRSMRVCRGWFAMMVANGAWSHQRRRICKRFPELEAFFAAHDPKSKKQSKQYAQPAVKKARWSWKIPRSGTWYTFKQYLSQGWTMPGLRDALKAPSQHVLLGAFLRNVLPSHAAVWRGPVVWSKTSSKRWFIVEFKDAAAETGKMLHFHVAPVQTYMKCMAYDQWHTLEMEPLMREWQMFAPDYWTHESVSPKKLPHVVFDEWANFILERLRPMHECTPTMCMYFRPPPPPLPAE